MRISPFYLGVTEVTRGQFRRFVDETGYKTEAERDGKGGCGLNVSDQDPRYTWLNPGFEQTDEHPVVNVSWNDAGALCEWLSRTEGQTYRLPTEAEWEYACRARTTTMFFNGDNPGSLAAVGNVADATLKTKYPNWADPGAAPDGFVYTAPAGQFQPNAFGLYDMHGNVWEWCRDWYDAEYYKRSPVADPPGPPPAAQRVVRGGSCFDSAWNCRSAFRRGRPPELRYYSVGFRLARVPSDRSPKAEATPSVTQAVVKPADRPTPGPIVRDNSPKPITNSIGMKLVLIPAGEFLMGSPDGDDQAAGDDEKPQHRVRITRPFYLGATEVTRGQFRRFVDEAGYQTEAEKDGKGGWGWNEEKKTSSKTRSTPGRIPGSSRPTSTRWST